jgi:hypothetical protein
MLQVLTLLQRSGASPSQCLALLLVLLLVVELEVLLPFLSFSTYWRCNRCLQELQEQGLWGSQQQLIGLSRGLIWQMMVLHVEALGIVLEGWCCQSEDVVQLP